MARNLPKPEEPQVSVPVEQTPPIPERELAPEDLGLTPTAAPVFGISRKRPVPKVPIKQYQVGRGPLPSGGWVIVSGGSRSELAMGKIIDERQYDIEKLRRMGVQLTEMGIVEA